MYSLADYLELVVAEQGAPRVASTTSSGRGTAGAAKGTPVRRGMTTAEVYDRLGFPATRRPSRDGDVEASVETWETRDMITEVTFVRGVVVKFTSSSK
jgi:hypothetical protein